MVCAGTSYQLCTDSGDSYLWSPGGLTTRCITVTGPGTWTVGLTRGSCNGTSDPFTVDLAPDPAEPQITADRDRFCLGGSPLLEEGPGYSSYTWLLDGVPTGDTTQTITITPTTGGTYRYSVTVSNEHGCTATSALRTIEVFPPVTPTLSESGTEVICDPQGTLYTYRWFINDTLVAGATRDRIPIERTGLYVVEITDANGCSARSDPLAVLARLTSTVMRLTCPPDRPFLIGEQITLPLLLESSQNLDPQGVRQLEVRVRYNWSVLSPQLTPANLLTEGRERVMTVTATRDANSTSGTLIDIPFTTLFGNTDCAEIRIDSIWWRDGTARVELADSTCRICLELCREGGTRLYRAEGALTLAQNRPNPFNATTLIEYEVIEHGPTSLYVLDMIGRRIETLLDEPIEAGRYILLFDASNLPSGTYICVLQSPNESVFKLMEVVK